MLLNSAKQNVELYVIILNIVTCKTWNSKETVLAASLSSSKCWVNLEDITSEVTTCTEELLSLITGFLYTSRS